MITEGPSDRHVLKGMYRVLNRKKIDFVIYPGTSANDLAPIISLNIGWNADFTVLLDNDKEGQAAARKYKKSLGVSDEIIFIPIQNGKIEGCFSKGEKEQIRKLVLGNESSTPVSKQEFAAMWALIAEDRSMDAKLKKILSKETNTVSSPFLVRI